VRRRVRGKTPDGAADLVRQRLLVEAFLAAARNGDFGALLQVLDSDVVLHVDAAAAGAPTTIRGAAAVAANARMFAANARFDAAGEKITQISIDADPRRLRGFSLAVLD